MQEDHPPPSQDVQSIISVYGEVDCLYWTGLKMFLSDTSYPHISQFTGMCWTSPTAPAWQIVFTIKVNAVATVANP